MRGQNLFRCVGIVKAVLDEVNEEFQIYNGPRNIVLLNEEDTGHIFVDSLEKKFREFGESFGDFLYSELLNGGHIENSELVQSAMRHKQELRPIPRNDLAYKVAQYMDNFSVEFPERAKL